MNAILESEPLAASAVPADTFALPKGDIADLLRCSPNNAPLNTQVLLDGCGGSPDFLTLMLGVFQSSAESLVDEIDEHVQHGDSDAVADAASKLKATADGVAAESLRALAATLEQFCGLMDRETQQRVVNRIREETNRCLEQIPMLIATASF